MKSFSIIVVFIALAIVGCALLPLLPVKLVPSQTLPSITVGYSMSGASARIVEQEVTSKVESALARVGSVKGIDSKSYNGGGRVAVSLDRHADMDNVRFEVSTLIRRIWDEMPEGVGYPNISVRQVDSEASRPFITLTLNAPANPSEILAYGEANLSPILSKVSGVGKVEFSGAQPMELKLFYDIDQLSAIGITPTDIRNAINEHLDSKFLGGASISNDGEEWLRISMKSVNSPEGFNPREIALTAKDGTSISLDKITNTIHEESAPNNYFRINGLNSIYVNITAEEDANQLRVAMDIEDALASFSTTLPAGYMIDKAYDATEEIHAELEKIYFRTGLTVLILLLFVALVSLSVRYVLMITIGLVINLAVALLFYYFTKIEIQLYSLAGITISLNLIIDNLIVMTDHYTRRRNLRVFTSVLAATLTTIGALSVVFFIDEKTRLSLQDFVSVVIINLAVSLAVALFLVPALIEKLDIHKSSRKGKFTKYLRKTAQYLSNVYEKSICFILEFRADFVIIFVLGFAGALYLFVEKVYDGSYWDRNAGEPILSINATLPNGATLEHMNTLIKKME
ncbi:MAG: efflux RND transporter permease subunit, partial [Muribaculaceae bacterium]|nr:efflux RND transporter permease subunit [Muribaculaceae bacterium]